MPGSPTNIQHMAQATNESPTANKPAGNTGGDPMFWLMFRQATVGIAFLSLEGFILQANPELCRFLGYPEEHLRTLTYHEITDPDVLLNSVEMYNTLAESNLPGGRMETRFLRSDGSIVWGQLSVTVVRDAAGKALSFMSMVDDISARKSAQTELELTRTRYGSILDGLDDLVFVCDDQSRLTYVNKTCLDLLGWTNQEMLGSNLYSYIHPEDKQQVIDTYEKFVPGNGQKLRVKCRICRSDGSWLSLETYARAVRSSSGAVKEIMGVGRDVQKQDEVHESLLQEIEQATVRTQTLEELALTDSLTGLRNRRAADDLLTSRLASWRSSAFPIGCILVDVDHFKSVNDSCGHSVGDEVLKRVAEVMGASCRNDDFVARYGGDEFLIVLPGTNPSGTIIVGEKLVTKIKEMDWSDLKIPGTVTISAGAANIQYGTGLTLPEVMGILDKQLYQAKESGRNRMVMNTRQIVKSDK